MLALLLACTPDPAKSGWSTPTDGPPPIDDSGATSDTDSPPLDCTHAESPVHPTFMNAIPAAEDFAFDAEGYVILVDDRGNLVAVLPDGSQELILPQAATFASGMRLLLDGDYVFSDATIGTLYRVDAVSLGRTALLTDLAYPNGLEIASDGSIFVSEQNGGRVRRVDPDTGAYEVIASGLYNPNGLSLGPGHDTLYIGSFGGGTLWQVDLGDVGVVEPVDAPTVVAVTPESPGVPPAACQVAGEACSSMSTGLGVCDEAWGALVCAVHPDEAACEGLAAGDACHTTRFDAPFDSVCAPLGDTLICPRAEAAYVEACAAGELQCTVDGDRGSCTASFEGVPVCYTTGEYDAYTADCVGSAVGDACVAEGNYLPYSGTCQDGSLWGFPGNICLSTDAQLSEHGGLDGLNVDACGSVYVTEYLQRTVWRFDPGEAEPVKVSAQFGAWIPNLHFGNGVGGWDPETLYVMDMERGIGALEVGVGGHGDAYVP